MAQYRVQEEYLARLQQKQDIFKMIATPITNAILTSTQLPPIATSVAATTTRRTNMARTRSAKP